jgi:hypothetical protein
LGLLDRQHWAIDVAALYGGVLPVGATSYNVTLVPPRTVPTSGNTWSGTTYASGTATVLLAGPQADSTGALVVTGSCDLWIMPVGGSDVREMKVGRVTVPGSEQAPVGLPSTYVSSVNGKSGVASLTFSDVGADAAGAATAAQAAAVASIPSMSAIAADPALRAAYGPVVASDNWLKTWAANVDNLIRSTTITRDANGAVKSAGAVWPDGTPGTYTTDTVSTAFPGAVDAYHVTYGSPALKTVTQPALTRDSTGAVTTRPALTVA